MRNLLISLLFFTVSACVSPGLKKPGAATDANRKPIIIGHRGASGYLPEHTIAAYEMAIAQGADFIEPDLVSTKDGVLVARHENEISQTTDVAVKFPKRKRVKVIDGTRTEGWFTEDFTWAELKLLRAKQRLPFREQKYNGVHAIAQFDEILDLIERKSRELGRVIGVYPETKHPSYFASLGLPLEGRLLAALEKHGLSRAEDAVFIQSFETSNLKDLRGRTKIRLVQLIGAPDEIPFDVRAAGGKTTYLDMLTPDGMRAIRTYADGIGPDKRMIIPQSADGRLGGVTRLIEGAHAAGLLVHAYTFRSDAQYLAAEYGGDPRKEYEQFFLLGVDGLFTDFPDVAVSVRSH